MVWTNNMRWCKMPRPFGTKPFAKTAATFLKIFWRTPIPTKNECLIWRRLAYSHKIEMFGWRSQLNRIPETATNILEIPRFEISRKNLINYKEPVRPFSDILVSNQNILRSWFDFAVRNKLFKNLRLVVNSGYNFYSVQWTSFTEYSF